MELTVFGLRPLRNSSNFEKNSLEKQQILIVENIVDKSHGGLYSLPVEIDGVGVIAARNPGAPCTNGAGITTNSEIRLENVFHVARLMKNTGYVFGGIEHIPTPFCRLFIKDRRSKCYFLIDTGDDISVVFKSFHSESLYSNKYENFPLNFYPANGTPTMNFGIITLSPGFGLRHNFCWKLIYTLEIFTTSWSIKPTRKYLALGIQNLSECRPSLVIGDRVKDENPWADGENVKEMYKGAIHEVLRNRILIRFDDNFQREYDYRDYRLEFCLSRYDYRKQHYAISRAAEKLGEQFLLPSQVQTRERSQLDVRLNGEESLLLDNRQYGWYNSTVKFIQKKAVPNILRGKIRNMPYVIFGPPGTGKTATLVEMIIQIFKLIPTARMLVGTPSNNSAYVITTQLIGVLRMYELIRLVSHKELKKGLIPEHLMPDIVVTQANIPKKWPKEYSTNFNYANPIIVNSSGNNLQAVVSSSPQPLTSAGRVDDLECILKTINEAKFFVRVSTWT
uniref:Uncharacterized protein n=1 Tax=Glossina palpalis gambiensis TaxID=67801 RepID=A0A1B0AN46_9MUSC